MSATHPGLRFAYPGLLDETPSGYRPPEPRQSRRTPMRPPLSIAKNGPGRLSVVGYSPGAPATGTSLICLVSGRRKPSAPITYLGSAAAGGGGAAITDRRVLETSLCPHAVPLKMAISSLWQDSALSRVSYARARGRGRRSRPGSGSRFLDAERERVSSQNVWLSGMGP